MLAIPPVPLAPHPIPLGTSLRSGFLHPLPLPLHVATNSPALVTIPFVTMATATMLRAPQPPRRRNRLVAQKTNRTTRKHHALPASSGSPQPTAHYGTSHSNTTAPAEPCETPCHRSGKPPRRNPSHDCAEHPCPTQCHDALMRSRTVADISSRATSRTAPGNDATGLRIKRRCASAARPMFWAAQLWRDGTDAHRPRGGCRGCLRCAAVGLLRCTSHNVYYGKCCIVLHQWLSCITTVTVALCSAFIALRLCYRWSLARHRRSSEPAGCAAGPAAEGHHWPGDSGYPGH